MARRRLVVITDKAKLPGVFYTAGYEGGTIRFRCAGFLPHPASSCPTRIDPVRNKPVAIAGPTCTTVGHGEMAGGPHLDMSWT